MNKSRLLLQYLLEKQCSVLLFRQGSARKRKGPISGTRGMDRFRSEESFYVNPLPDCLCQREQPNSQASSLIRR